MKNIVVLGSSGHAKVIVEVIRKSNEYNIVGYIDNLRKVGESSLNLQVIGSESDLPTLISKHSLYGCFVAIGDNFTRKKVVDNIGKIAPSLKFVTAIHPNAIISDSVSIGQGSVVMAGAIINTSVDIGEFCIINTNSSIDHDCSLSDFVSIAPNVTLGGSCMIGQLSAIGIGTNLIHGVRIGENCVIGAGSLVLKAVEDNVVSYGIPAKGIRLRHVGEKYL
ncbi:acetyltransferase [Vibrio splendidus]|uniref:acetyltransferase n=1 Tax=Vibrio splendidus TaxID=29497 RepID=UPI002468BA76|nr:acetyltransferase [Vibrio splendidus]MDH6018077.1 acetyltransferase [Vibrio splendidus]